MSETTMNDEGREGALTLDEATALLLQLGPEDSAELGQIRDALERLLPGYAAWPIVQELLSDAITILDALARGEAPEPDEALAEVGTLIEAVMKVPATSTGAPSASAADALPADASAADALPADASAVDALPADASAVDALPADADVSLLTGFVDEGREYLAEAETALLALELDPEDMEACNTVFRAFHTIKGTAGFLGLDSLMELAHHAESLLSRVRDREIRLTGGFAELALSSIDWIGAYLSKVQAAIGGEPLRLPDGFVELSERLAAAADSAPEAAADLETTAAFADGPASEAALAGSESAPESDRVADVASARDEVAGPDAAPAQDPGSAPETAAEASRPDSAVRRGAGESWVRVRTDRLDNLIDMIGELVIAHTIVVEDVARGGIGADSRNITHAGKIVRELQDLSISMRMVPLQATFQRMARVIRDVSRQRGREVRFVTASEDTEIDRNMVERIADPLVHMIRNAVDHGIESPEEREAAGKPRFGTVRLSAYHAGGNVVIELRDDGRGLDRGRIVAKAMANGLIESDRGLSDGEVYRLIFEPGFSTAEKVTNVSGRGVGLDVVRRNIEALRGRIDVESEPGRGSTFALRLPLTLAITDGMLVRVGSERYIVPTTSIQMSFRPSADALSTVAGRGEMVMVRDEVVPLVRLHRLFHVPDAQSDPTNALLVLIGAGERRCALMVDELIAQQQVVAKSLGRVVGQVQGISGGAILGDGRVGLILEPAQIINTTRPNGYGPGPSRERSVA